MPISPAQCRAARGLIGLDQGGLAEAASVSRNTIIQFETGRRVPWRDNLTAIQAALEAAGVIFVKENGEGPGVRLRKER
jgi:transcriptional regulator with XRE-family HTH domain